MKTTLLISALASGILFSAKAQTFQNCNQILSNNPTAETGVYTIDPDGDGVLPAMNCYCDMSTDGGGWTLILNYNHKQQTEPLLKVRTDSLPLLGSTELDTDESNTMYWGHAGNTLASAIPFDEVRFYGITSNHNRVIHFKTYHAGTIAYFKTGIGSTEGIKTDFSPFIDHTSYLPASIDMTVSNQGDYAMTEYPLWTGAMHHWYLGSYDNYCNLHRWEVDDYPCNSVPSTIHQIWVRQSDASKLYEPQTGNPALMIYPNPAKDRLTLSFRKEPVKDCRIQIFDGSGRLVYSDRFNTQSKQVEISTLCNGIYYLAVQTDAEYSIQKLVINR